MVSEKTPLDVVGDKALDDMDEKAPIEDDVAAVVGQVISEKVQNDVLRQRRVVEVI